MMPVAAFGIAWYIIDIMPVAAFGMSQTRMVPVIKQTRLTPGIIYLTHCNAFYNSQDGGRQTLHSSFWFSKVADSAGMLFLGH